MIVCDSSPLIALASIDKLFLLDSLFSNWHIPPAVYTECCIKDKPYAENLQLVLASHIKPPSDIKLIEALSFQIGKGESEAIVLAEEMGINLVLIDDLKGRRYVKLKNLEPIGTVGILLAAKKHGLVTEIKKELSNLKQSGIHVSDTLIKKALDLSGENQS